VHCVTRQTVFHGHSSTGCNKGVGYMTNKEQEMLEKLADEVEVVVEDNYGKRDLKEKRGMTKNSLYDGSKKLKHSIPKGKHLK